MRCPGAGPSLRRAPRNCCAEANVSRMGGRVGWGGMGEVGLGGVGGGSSLELGSQWGPVPYATGGGSMNFV